MAGNRAALDDPGLTPGAKNDGEMYNILHKNPKTLVPDFIDW